MTDLISRQDAIDALDKQFWRSSNIPICKEIRNVAKETIKALPSAQPEQRWIPCSEALPDVRHKVLITDGYHTAEGQLQDNGDWWQYRWTCLRKHNEIIAWQPLPEPYREVE